MQKKHAILIGILAAAYAVLRLWGLADGCLWFDEIFSIHAAEHTWSGLVEFAAKDLIHPPLFYFVLKLWISVFGDSVLSVRMLPAVLSILALFPLWMLCRELKLRPAVITVAFGLFTVNGALIKYAQEVRMYSLLLFLSLMSIWLFSRYYFRGKSFWTLVLINVLLVNTHYFGWFVVAAEVAAIVIAQRIKTLQTLLMVAVTAAGFVLWVIALFRFAEPGSTVTQNIGWMKRPGFAALLEFGFDLLDPFYYQQSTIDPGANFFIALPLAAIILAGMIVFLVDFKVTFIGEKAVFLFIIAAVPVLLAFALSWVMPVSIWGSRHLLIVFAPASLLFAIFLAEIRPTGLSYVLIASASLLIAAGGVVYIRTESPKQIWCAWESLADDWTAASKEDPQPERLYVFEDLAAYHYWFAVRRNPGQNVTLIKGIEGIHNDPAYFLPRGFDGVSVAGLDDVRENEIWLSFRQATPGHSGQVSNDGGRRFEVPVTNFENLGYRVDAVYSRAYGPQTAYLVRMQR